MKFEVFTIGKLRSKAFTEASADYIRRISRATRIEMHAISGEEFPPEASDSLVQKKLALEGERIRAKLSPAHLLVCLDRQGKALTSPDLAKHISTWQNEGRNTVAFAIGSAFGLHDSILKAAHLRFSLSALTLPHEMALVVLLEQIYRAPTILRGEPYHR